MKKYSVAIISQNQAGYLLASLLEQQGATVALVDTSDGMTSGPKDLRFRSLDLDKKNLPLLIIEDSQAKPFVGFGDHASPAVAPLSRYNTDFPAATTWDYSTPEAMGDTRTMKVLRYSELTGVEFVGPLVDKIVINGAQALEAERYVFMNTPYELMNWLPQNVLTARVRSRIAKTPAWARVTLQWTHSKPVTEIQNLIVLTPSSAEQDPFIGQFSDAGQSPLQHSTWETYVPQELCEDAEHIATVFKTIRRLVRRAFPDIEEKPRETLSVTPFAAADFSWAAETQPFNEIAENFHVASPLLLNSLGFSQCEAAAKQALLWFQALAPSHPDSSQPTLLESAPT
jgi:hypothetical protein